MREVKFFAVRATTYATLLIETNLYVGISIPPGRSFNLLRLIRTGRLTSTRNNEAHSHFCWCFGVTRGSVLRTVNVSPNSNAPADWAIHIEIKWHKRFGGGIFM